MDLFFDPFFEVLAKTTLSAALDGQTCQKWVQIRDTKMPTYGCPISRFDLFVHFPAIFRSPAVNTGSWA